MKKWLYSFKFIIIIILFIGFAAYYYLTKDSKESFQQQQQQQQTNDGDYHYPHFDISANYYDLSESEKAQMKAVNPDSIILNIGNSLGGGIDINNIPWDSENRSLNPSELLWGVVSREASADIFHKVFVAQQLYALQAAEDNKFYFDSALLHYGTADPQLGAFMEMADFIANFASPLILPMIGSKLGGDEPLFESDLPESPVTKQTNAAKDIEGVMDATTEKREYTKMKAMQHSRVSHIFSPDKKQGGGEGGEGGEGAAKKPKPKESPTSFISRLKSGNIKFKASRLLGKLITLYFDWIELIPPPVGPILNGIYMIVIMPIVMAIAMPLIAPKKGSNAVVENNIIGVAVTLVAMAVTAGYGMIDPANVIAQRATMAAALAGALAAYYQQKVAVPAGYKSMMEKMLEQTGHGSGDGKCPNGFIPLNQVWNPTTQIFLSFVPIFGDLIDLLYPYLCISKDFKPTVNDRAQNPIENLICIRDPYILPKYMNHSWISSIFLDWPDYNNKLSTGTNTVGGKMRIVQTVNQQNLNTGLYVMGINNRDPYWSWSGYTNFNDIKNNPENYYNLNVKLDGFNQNNIYQYIGGKSSEDSPNPSLSCKFFYLDFSDPNILVEMAQFYYNNAIRNPQLGDDRTFTIEYIAKINYVTASSLFTCDAICEMVNIKYDARSGRILKQTRTYDADRRFYFRWRPISASNSNCMIPSDIWGNNANNAVWRGLDDTYDEAMYRLNDAIHFPTDPSDDPTGLISGDLLITAYELYLEQKNRSDLAEAYILFINPTNTALTAAKAAYEAASMANNNVMTTGQMGGVQDLTSLQNSFIEARNALEIALEAADPFYLDFKINTETARNNYLDVLGKLYTTNENPNIFFQNDLVFRGPILRDLQSRMDAVITARNALWNQHKKDASINGDGVNFKYGLESFDTTKYYDVTGCTHLDGGALTAVTPDVTNLQEDIRFPANFDVLPHLKRCENMNITLDKCIDLSNVEQVIQAYQRDKPDIRIKTIHNIKARGNNTCQYIWDEYNIATPTTITQTTNRILYQQDLSACTFCLPEVANQQKIYIDTSDNMIDLPDNLPGTIPITKSLTVTPPQEIKHFVQPIPVTDIKNNKNTLKFLGANYIQPRPQPGGGEPAAFDKLRNQLLVPRYDPNTYKKLPDLVRPKKAIRISYPNGVESNLGGQTSNYCSGSTIMNNFIIDYNNRNTSEKIVNIQRAFTTGPTKCDYEIDVFIKDPTNLNGLLETNIIKILNIGDTTTQIRVINASLFTKGMTMYIRYSSTPSFTYTQTVSFILEPTATGPLIGIAPLTPSMFNPYEYALRNKIPSTYRTGIFTIVGFTPQMYKLTTNNGVTSGTLICIVTMSILNSSTKNSTTYVVEFSVSFGTINNNGETSSTANIISPYGPSCDNNIIVGNPIITANDTLATRITSLGSKTVDSDELYSIFRIITVTETLSPYNSESKTPCLSQSIQGMRVISDIDVSNNKITYKNNIDILPLDIDYYPENDRIDSLGNHTAWNIKDIPATAATTPPTAIGNLVLKNIVSRKTVSYNMTPYPRAAAEAFTNTPYTYDTIDASGGGIEIKKNTSTLEGSFSNTGYNFAGPAKSNIYNIFTPNTTYYNDNLVSKYTTNMSNLMSRTSEYLKPLVAAITLSNVIGTPQTDRCASQPNNPPTNVCSNPIYMQRIMDAYNNANSPIGIYNQERNTMTKIIRASTAENNECRITFENKNEFYNDITDYNLNNSNNYTVTNTLKFINVPMTSNGNICDFNPRKIPVINVISNSSSNTYPPIKPSDLTLSYGNDLSPYFTGLRSGICQVGDTATLFDALITDYRSKANTPTTNPLYFTSISKISSSNIAYDKIDYLISQTNISVTRRYVLRAKFDLAPYPANCVWSYTPGSFRLQTVLPDDMTAAQKGTYSNQSFVDVVDVDSVSLGGSDNVSRLFLDLEYS